MQERAKMYYNVILDNVQKALAENIKDDPLTTVLSILTTYIASTAAGADMVHELITREKSGEANQTRPNCNH